jgi:hypothetical protein
MVRAGVVPHPAQWPWCSYTESIAVGSRAFVEAIAEKITHRQRLSYSMVEESAWVLREDLPSRVEEESHGAGLDARMTG